MQEIITSPFQAKCEIRFGKRKLVSLEGRVQPRYLPKLRLLLLTLPQRVETARGNLSACLYVFTISSQFALIKI